jgi:hypothetical protein
MHKEKERIKDEKKKTIIHTFTSPQIIHLPYKHTYSNPIGQPPYKSSIPSSHNPCKFLSSSLRKANCYDVVYSKGRKTEIGELPRDLLPLALT